MVGNEEEEEENREMTKRNNLRKKPAAQQSEGMCASVRSERRGRKREDNFPFSKKIGTKL